MRRTLHPSRLTLINKVSLSAEADVGVLVISARKGEFETGFERGGQTREHALLAKTLGVRMVSVPLPGPSNASVCVCKMSWFLACCAVVHRAVGGCDQQDGRPHS